MVLTVCFSYPDGGFRQAQLFAEDPQDALADLRKIDGLAHRFGKSADHSDGGFGSRKNRGVPNVLVECHSSAQKISTRTPIVHVVSSDAPHVVC